MVIDGKALALEIRTELENRVQALGRKPRLNVIFFGNDRASESFVKRKQIVGEAAGFDVVVHRPEDGVVLGGGDFFRFCGPIFRDVASDAVIVQLPVPDLSEAETREILDAIPSEKDADVLSRAAFERFAGGDFSILPPVVAAIDFILKKYAVSLRGKNIAVVGARGELVGKPVSAWLDAQKISFHAVGRQMPRDERDAILKNSDIIISGVGNAGMIIPDMVKDGIVVLDAGTSGASGALRGDFEPAVALKASLFTPVPGGIGPLTVAMLFQNVLALSQKK